MASRCPHCGCNLPVFVDAFCGECRGALDELPAVPIAALAAPRALPQEGVPRYESLAVRVHDRARILRNLSAYWPVAASSAFLYFVFGLIALVSLLQGPLGPEAARAVGVPAAAVVVLVSGALYVRHVVNGLARSGLYLERDAVVARRATLCWGLVERRYAAGELKAVVFGEPLNGPERALERLSRVGLARGGGVRLVQDLKAGRLVLVDRDDRRQTFHFSDKVFDRESLTHFAVELGRRGVTVVGAP